MIRRRNSLPLSLMCLCVAIAAAPAAPPSVLEIPRTPHAPTIDGTLDDDAWSKAARVSGFVTPEGVMATADTEVLIARDNANLYVAYRCHEPNMAGLSARAKHHEQIWQAFDDSIALFVQPDETADVYYQFAVTPAGTRMTQQREKGISFYRDRPWDVEAGREANAWVAEMAIPFSTLDVIGQMGRVWRMNFCRARHQGRELSDWMGVGKSWHAAPKFGKVRGMLIGGGRPEDSPLRLRAVSLPEAKPMQDLSLAADIENTGETPVEVTANVFTKSPSARTRNFSRELRLKPGGVTQVLLPFQMLPERGDHALWFVITDRAGKRSLLTSPRTSLALAAMVTAFADRSYYTTEPTARVLLDLPAFGKNVRVELQCNGKTYQQKVFTARPGRHETAFNLKPVPNGTHTVRVTLMDESDTACGEAMAELVKLAPLDKGREVKIDREKLVTLVEGEPFFPCGFCTVRDTAEDLQRMIDMGADTVFTGWGRYGDDRGPDLVRAALDRAHELGLLVYDWIPHGVVQHNYAHPDFRKTLWEKMEKDYPALVRSTVHHPAFLSWMFMDEPNLAPGHTRDGKGVLQELQAQVAMARRADPYHPVTLNFCRTITDDPDWMATFDIGMIDPYWAPLRRGDKVTYVAAAVKTARDTTDRHRKVLNVILNAEMVSSSARPLLPAEHRAQAYATLINGARGLIYYIYPVKFQATREILTTLCREVKHLSPALLEPEPSQKIVCDSPGAGEFIASLRRSGDKYWLLCANLSPEKTFDTSFSVTGLPGGSTVPVTFEDRTLQADDFRDTFEPYASHVYEFETLNVPDGHPVVVQIRAEARGASAEKAFTAVPTEKNLVGNADIEDGLKGWRYVCWGNPTSRLMQKGWRDRETTHSGGGALHLKRGNKESANHFISAPFTLKPNTRYRFGGWMKSAVEEGEKGPTLQVLYTSGGTSHYNPRYVIQTVGQTMVNISGRMDWKEHSRQLVTGDLKGDEKFFLYCSFYHSIGDAWFDDLYVVEEGTVARQVNLIPNSGVEALVMPGCPAWWIAAFFRPAVDEPLLGAPGSRFATDDVVRYEGQRSLRLYGPYKGEGQKKNRTCTLHADSIVVDGGEPYTFSVYLKADHENTPARLFMLHRQWKFPTLWADVTVGTDWKRYTLAKTLAPEQGVVSVRVDLMDQGILWIDAAQLEKGEQATEYQARE